MTVCAWLRLLRVLQLSTRFGPLYPAVGLEGVGLEPAIIWQTG